MVTYDDFKTITQFSTQYEESGRSYDENNRQYYHMDEERCRKYEHFDEMIRDPVYMLLKYRGSFKEMITSPYFIDLSQKYEFYFKASPKVPFYMVYECSPKI